MPGFTLLPLFSELVLLKSQIGFPHLLDDIVTTFWTDCLTPGAVRQPVLLIPPMYPAASLAVAQRLASSVKIFLNGKGSKCGVSDWIGLRRTFVELFWFKIIKPLLSPWHYTITIIIHCLQRVYKSWERRFFWSCLKFIWRYLRVLQVFTGFALMWPACSN